jgi:hypothetical protein
MRGTEEGLSAVSPLRPLIYDCRYDVTYGYHWKSSRSTPTVRIRSPLVRIRDPDPFHNVTDPKLCFATVLIKRAGLHILLTHIRLFILQGGGCWRYVTKCDHRLAQRPAGGQAGLQVYSQGPLCQVGRRKFGPSWIRVIFSGSGVCVTVRTSVLHFTTDFQ